MADQLFEGITKGEYLLNQGDGKYETRKFKVSTDEKGSLLTLLFLTTLRKNWVNSENQDHLRKWDGILKDNRGIFGGFFSSSSKELYACFQTLMKVQKEVPAGGTIDCDRASAVLSPAQDFLTACKSLAPIIEESIIEQNTQVGLIYAANTIRARKKAIDDGVTSAFIGQNSREKCEVSSDSEKTKALAEFVQFASDPVPSVDGANK
jgi:hypothetical protein